MTPEEFRVAIREELKPLRDDLSSLIRAHTAPDDGWYTRINKNTTWRKFHQKIYWLFAGALIFVAITHLI